MRTYEFMIGRAEAGLRLDRYLAGRLPATISRAMIQRAILDGRVTVGRRLRRAALPSATPARLASPSEAAGVPASVGAHPVKVHYKLCYSDTVTARFDQLPAKSRDRPITPQELPLDIVYEDEAFLVVNKPAGLVTHPAPGHWEGTLVNALVWHLYQAQGSGLRAQGKGPQQPRAPSPERPLNRAGIVHRLDKDTSGLLLVAKTELAHVSLAKQMKARLIRRRYLAAVEGHLPLDEGTINVPIGRHLTHRKQMTVRHLGGRVAVTHYRVLARRKKMLGVQDSRLGAVAQSPEPRAQNDFPYTVVDVSLETGRTHQIRVHCAHLGHPVIGDTAYGKRSASVWRTYGVARQLLHAYHLSFRHPLTQRPVTLTAPVPEDMRAWVGDTP